MDLSKYQNIIQQFADERNWEQYHNPKNLVMALSGEVGELTEIFQWQNEEESKNLSDKDLQSAKEEIADIFIYLLRISDKLGIDVEDAVNEKLEINASRITPISTETILPNYSIPVRLYANEANSKGDKWWRTLFTGGTYSEEEYPGLINTTTIFNNYLQLN